eukprot:TRINITY_DN4702_c0_g1_i1.p1 TRINITY_DN4702_c0_g1~~TRINITY_DN4702_c0_g1_i1.p1  ORF type:complete len:225 (-),score=63.42 TRINITY_DN4702_c0_g1_i1:199-873(-)
MKAKMEREANLPLVAKETYSLGLKHCPQSIALWKNAAELESSLSSFSKARALLEQARLKIQKNPGLWLAAIRTEISAGNKAMAENLMSKALQDCPNSGLLWSESIFMEKQKTKQKIIDALKKCDHDALVTCAVARSFWADRKVDKARTWFKRALSFDPDIGDIWSFYYKFEVQHGTQEQQNEVVKDCVKAAPRHGEVWSAVVKAPENRKLSTEMILKKVALTLK